MAGYVFVILADFLVCLLFVFLGLKEAVFLMKMIYFIVAAILLVGSLLFFSFYISYRRRKLKDLPKD
jgi:hypothetical protein